MEERHILYGLGVLLLVDLVLGALLFNKNQRDNYDECSSQFSGDEIRTEICRSEKENNTS